MSAQEVWLLTMKGWTRDRLERDMLGLSNVSVAMACCSNDQQGVTKEKKRRATVSNW